MITLRKGLMEEGKDKIHFEMTMESDVSHSYSSIKQIWNGLVLTGESTGHSKDPSQIEK